MYFSTEFIWQLAIIYHHISITGRIRTDLLQHTGYKLSKKMNPRRLKWYCSIASHKQPNKLQYKTTSIRLQSPRQRYISHSRQPFEFLFYCPGIMVLPTGEYQYNATEIKIWNKIGEGTIGSPLISKWLVPSHAPHLQKVSSKFVWNFWRTHIQTDRRTDGQKDRTTHTQLYIISCAPGGSAADNKAKAKVVKSGLWSMQIPALIIHTHTYSSAVNRYLDRGLSR